MKLKFYGAAGGNVVPSRYHFWNSTNSLLMECGDIVPDDKKKVHKADFGSLKPSGVQKVIYSHAHTDHVGALCDFVEAGFNGEIESTNPSKEITEALLRKHYSSSLVDDVFELYGKTRKYLSPFEIGDGVRATFYPAQGHVLGASSILLELEKEKLRVLFSGDLGNTNKTMLEVSGEVPEADIVIMESTYGRREHHPNFEESLKELYDGINETYKKYGNFHIPILSISKLQEALYSVNLGMEKGLIPKDINIVVDAPLGEIITEIYSRKHNRQFYSKEARKLFSKIDPFKYTTEIDPGGRNIILSSSGLDGLKGRFRQHWHDLTSPNNSIAVVSHTIEGSLLNDIAKGKKTVGTNGGSINLKAKSSNLSGFSSHADATQLTNWLIKTKAKYVFLVHGEDDSRTKLKEMIVAKGIFPEEKIFMPALLEEFDLTNLPVSAMSYTSTISDSNKVNATKDANTENEIILFGRKVPISKPKPRK